MRFFFTNSKEERCFLHTITAASGMVLFLLCGTGCGNEPKDGVAVMGMTVPVQQAPFKQSTGYLPALYLDRAGFLRLDSLAKYKGKLVLQLQQPAEANNIMLTVYAIEDKKKPGKNIGKPADKSRVEFPKPFANALNIAGKKLQFANQQASEDEFQKLVGEVRKHRLIRYILFEPEIEGDHIRFKITGVEKLPLDLLAHGFATRSYYSQPL